VVIEDISHVSFMDTDYITSNVRDKDLKPDKGQAAAHVEIAQTTLAFIAGIVPPASGSYTTLPAIADLVAAT